MYWINISSEWQDRNAIERQIADVVAEALEAWEHGLTARFWQLVETVDCLEAEREHPFTLEIAW